MALPPSDRKEEMKDGKESPIQTSKKNDNALIEAWETFVSLAKTARKEDIAAFLVMVPKHKFVDLYPKGQYTLSFSKGTQEEFINGMEIMLRKYKKDEAMSDSRRKSVANIGFNVSACMGSGRIKSPKCFTDLVIGCLNTNKFNRIGDVLKVVEEHAEDGEVEWDTPNGAPIINKDEYGNWIIIKPRQFSRCIWHINEVHKLPRVCTMPVKEDIPVYKRSYDGKTWKRTWIQSKKTKDGKANWKEDVVVIDEQEFGSTILRLDAYTKMLGFVSASANMTERNGIYVLIMIDDDAPNQWKLQTYVGKAEPGVKKRWFSGGNKTISSHINAIRAVLDGGSNALLVDAALAHAWAINKTWCKRAWLFVVKSGLKDEEVKGEETKIIETLKTIDPINGLNQKL
jgi:hypothetical protein